MSADGTLRNRTPHRIPTFKDSDVLISPPSRLLLALETRAWAEFAAFLLMTPLMRRLPRGDGHPVLVIPGFGGGDLSTLPMRRLMRQLGYAAYGWGLGRNLGMRPEIKDALSQMMVDLVERHDARITLIGWSLGGVYVREMARQRPDLVRQVITMGSPINGRPDANNVATMFNLFNRNKGVKLDWDGFQRRRVPPPVPCTAIFSRTDGVVAWQCCREEELPHTENVEVFSSHFGLGVNPQVMVVLADRLALPEGAWRRFELKAWQEALGCESRRKAA
jgi:pimeloyl-ACP methyl ester carboxylesterase